MRQQFFLFVECEVGRAYAVANRLRKLDLRYCQEIALISGEWDVLIRSECDAEVDVGRELVTIVQAVEHVKRTRTEIGYPIFDPDEIFFDEEGDP